MRFVFHTVVAATLALATAAAAQVPLPPRPPAAPALPTAAQAAAAQRGLTDSQMRRRDALMGEGWQYRIAPPDAATIAAMNIAEGAPPADLSNLDLRIRTDEVRLTRLRDSAIARGNAVVFAVEPALPYERERRKRLDVDRYLINLDPFFVDLWKNIRSIPDRIF